MNAYRITEIRRATLNGQEVKLFFAYRKARTFHYCVGEFSAPAKTPNRDLWKIADAACSN